MSIEDEIRAKKEKMQADIRKAEAEGFSFAVIDAAALLESSCKDLCEKIIVVTAPEKIRLSRVLLRDGITKEQALIRINAQFPDEYYNENTEARKKPLWKGKNYAHCVL